MKKFSVELLLSAILFVVLVTTYTIFNLFDDRTDKDIQLQTQAEIISDLQMQLETFGELTLIYPENRALVVAIAYSESRCSKSVTHPDKHTSGIGGIKDLWQLECDQNSLMAIEEVVENIREANPQFSDYQVIKYYKGADKNLGSTNSTYEMYLALKNIL